MEMKYIYIYIYIDVTKARIPSTIKLIGYKHQNQRRTVTKYIYLSIKEKFCSDPKASWIQDHLKGLKEIVD
uniref:Chemokine (C-C motif) ligand 34b, duplicate 4 n=1 Tax=Sinocyclocheilus grahami TaxID=75366 RepID=A0A672ME68_SINGR